MDSNHSSSQCSQAPLKHSPKSGRIQCEEAEIYIFLEVTEINSDI